MYFLYKTKDGKVGKVSNVNRLQKQLSKLIVKDYDGSHLRLPQCNKLVLDLNYNNISLLYFDADVLSVYRNYSGWFRFGIGGYFRVLKHLDMRNVTDMDRTLMYSSVTKICELDYKNVKISYQLFHKSQLTNIPPMRNYEHLHNNIFEGTNIPIHKERTWSMLMKINKQRCL